MTSVATDRKAFRWVLAGLGLFALIISLNPRRGIDLRVYLTAAERFWAHQPLYQEADGPMPFKYAPAAAWLFSPFTLLPARLGPREPIVTGGRVRCAESRSPSRDREMAPPMRARGSFGRKLHELP